MYVCTPPTLLRHAPTWPFNAASTSPTPRLLGSNRSTPCHCVPSLEKNDRRVGHIPAPCVPWSGKCRPRNPPRPPSVGAWCGTAHTTLCRTGKQKKTKQTGTRQHSTTKKKHLKQRRQFNHIHPTFLPPSINTNGNIPANDRRQCLCRCEWNCLCANGSRGSTPST
jgi:hypothetical protein